MIYLPLLAILLFLGPMLSAIAIRRSLSAQRQSALIGICLFYGILPLITAWIGVSLGDRFDCPVSSITYRCFEAPQLSELISWLVLSHWLAVITIPSAVLGIIGLLISLRLTSSALRWAGTDASTPPAVFYRSRRDKVVAGLCAALAQRWRLPVLGIRAVAVVLLIVTSILASCVYLWCWIAFPLEPPFRSAS